QLQAFQMLKKRQVIIGSNDFAFGKSSAPNCDNPMGASVAKLFEADNWTSTTALNLFNVYPSGLTFLIGEQLSIEPVKVCFGGCLGPTYFFESEHGQSDFRFVGQLPRRAEQLVEVQLLWNVRPMP